MRPGEAVPDTSDREQPRRRALQAPRVMLRGRATVPYSTPSGSSSSRFATYARSASSTASSIGGGS